MSREARVGDGVLGFDETGVAKPGPPSVGVERQYAGPLGQVGNCQVAVTCCSTDPQATWPVAVQLYLPKSWAHAPTRRREARGPAGVAFQTKPEMALALLEQARAWGIPHRGVVADADDGDHPHFLAGLEARQEPYGVGVRTDFRVSRGPAATTPVWRVDARLPTAPRWPWRAIRWRRGVKGWLRKKFLAVRAWRVTSDGQRHEGWLVGERATQGLPEARKYSWSHLPGETALAELAGLAHRRPAIEPLHEEAKGELGWDQDQGRLWPGRHRQAVPVMLASSFLVWLAQRHRPYHRRQSRPCAPFSPSAEAPAQPTASRAS